jgi:cold shock CspA family protein
LGKNTWVFRTGEVKGYGFISCEAFPDQDVFVLKSELPQGAKGGKPWVFLFQ